MAIAVVITIDPGCLTFGMSAGFFIFSVTWAAAPAAAHPRPRSVRHELAFFRLLKSRRTVCHGSFAVVAAALLPLHGRTSPDFGVHFVLLDLSNPFFVIRRLVWIAPRHFPWKPGKHRIENTIRTFLVTVI